MIRPAHGPRPRHLVIVLAVMALLTALAGPVAAADPPTRTGGKVLPSRAPARTLTAVPSGQIGFKSYLGWVYDGGAIAVVGEVQNNTSARRQAISIKVTYYPDTDPGSASLGSKSDAVLLDSVARGAVGPFVVYDPSPPAGVGAFVIEITSTTPTTTPAGGRLEITRGTSYVDNGVRYVPGTIRNPNAFAVDDVLVALTAYNAAGNVGEVMTPASLLGPIAAGGSASFLIGISADFGSNFTLDHISLLADGFRASNSAVYVTSWANYFDDIYATSFREDIIWLAEQGITKGCGAGKYCPESNVHRDEMASFIARSAGITGSAPDRFTDDEGNTHEANINLIAEAGVTTGCSATKYCPSDNVSRGQMASFLARAFGIPATATDYFTDDEGNTHEANINKIRAAGITTGCTATTYCPSGLVTRGQMAAFLHRAVE